MTSSFLTGSTWTKKYGLPDWTAELFDDMQR